MSEFHKFAYLAKHGAPTPSNAYGNPGEECQRVFRTIRGTKGGVRPPGVHKGTPKQPKRN